MLNVILRKVLDIIRAQEEMKDLHDQFHNQVCSLESYCCFFLISAESFSFYVLA